jgi:hypothetical protein
MPTTFLNRCPITGRQVQGWIADDPADYPAEDDGGNFQSVACLACAGMHVVGPRTGKVLGPSEH